MATTVPGTSSRHVSEESDWAQRVRRLEAEVAGLRRSMRTRGLIEQAKGRLAERFGIGAEDAFDHLSRMSQERNVRVIDLASDIAAVGAIVAEGTGAADGTVAAGGGCERPSTPPGPAGEERPIARLRAVAGALEDPDDFLTLLHSDALKQLAPESVALFVTRPDGGQTLAAASGWPTSVIMDWRSIPSAIRTPAAEAVRSNQVLWLRDGGGTGLTLIGGARWRVVMPLRDAAGRAVGALEFGWSGPVADDDCTVSRLNAVSEVAARWLRGRDLGRVGDAPVSDTGRWIEATLDAVLTPAAVLSPITDDAGQPIDFVIDYANGPATSHWSRTGAQPIGRRLGDVDPAAVTDGRFDECLRAYGRDLPLRPTPEWTVTRVGSRLVVMWLSAGSLDDRGVESRLAHVERMGAFGWAEWSLAFEPTVWSAGVDSLFGPFTNEAGSVDRLLATAEPQNRAMLASALERAAQGHPASAELRLGRSGARSRILAVSAAPRLDHHGVPRAILTLFRDITEARRYEIDAKEAAERLAAQRVQAAIERTQTGQLRAALFPAPAIDLSHGAVRILARHTSPASIGSFRGDFYEIARFRDTLAIVVGDVFGSGVAAADAMVRLRHAARALALAGHGPDVTLALLNQELCEDADPPLASAVVASFDADGRTVTWAQAGHYSPILVRGDRGCALRRSKGDALGLLADTRYAASAVTLRPGDVLVFFTDGILNREDGSVLSIRQLVADIVAACRSGGAEAVVRRFAHPVRDEVCVVAVDCHAAG